MVEDLEGATPQVEVENPTPDEGVKPTPPVVEPTIRTYTQKELDEAVGKGLSSVQSQLSLSKAEARKVQAEAEKHEATVKVMETELKSLREEYDRSVEQQFADDPEARKAFLDRRAIADSQRKLAWEKTELEHKLYDVELRDWRYEMDKRANELVAETGIDINEFAGSKTKEEMEVKALRFQIGKKPAETQKVDSLISSGTGVDLSGMTPRQLIQRGIDKGKK